MAKPRRPIDVWSTIILFSLFTINILIWRAIFYIDPLQYPRIYFLSVTQGSSELLMLSEDVNIMIDSGGDDGILQKIDPLFADTAGPYINIAIISYPQINNYEGYYYLLDHYTIGAFIYDGRNDVEHDQDWKKFIDAVNAKNIPLITLSKGDRIDYGNNVMTILSPDVALVRSADITDAALVENIRTSAFTAFLASDIGSNVAHMLATTSMHADILKVPYPAVDGSNGVDLIKKIAPRIAVIQPGTKNTANAPSKAMISQFASSTTATIFETARDGTVAIYKSDGKLRILKGK